MNITDFIAKYKNHPVLFIGTGMSLRYFENSFSWDNLLKKIIVDIYGNDEIYYDIKGRYANGQEYNYPQIATEIEDKFNKHLESDRHGHYKNINDHYYALMRDNNIQISRFKLYLAEIFSNLQYKDDCKVEIDLLKKARKNISSIITTNYDSLIEEIFEFNPLIGNDILLSNPYGSVYKIHGCYKFPKSIIITENDYNEFDNKYSLIRAQLLSIFIHNPIIFLGYSLSDRNIKDILKTIYDCVEINTTISDNIRNNFLIIEREEGIEETNVTEYDIALSKEVIIKVNKVKTDNYAMIYDSIANLQLPISAMDIRKVQSIVKEIYSGEGIKVQFTEDIDTLKNQDKVVAIGSNKTIKYNYLTHTEFLNNYFKIIEEANHQLITLIDKYTINSNQHFPIFGFIRINPNIEKKDKLIENQKRKINEIKDRVFCEKYTNTNNTIKDVLEDQNIPDSSKNFAICYGILNNNIPLNELEEYLRNTTEKNTDYKRLLVIYDYIRYNGNIKN